MSNIFAKLREKLVDILDELGEKNASDDSIIDQFEESFKLLREAEEKGKE